MGINNNKYQRNANTALITRTIWQNPGISRVEIADMLGLYRSTVTNIVSSLIESQVLYEGQLLAGSDKGGRRRVGLQLNAQFGCVIGIDLQPGVFHLVVMDIVGNVLHTHSGNFSKIDLAKVVLGILKTAGRVLERLRRPILALCLSVPGAVDSSAGIIIHSLPLDIHDYPLGENLASRLSFPILVDNDANCYTWLQLGIHRKEQLEDFLCIFGVYHEPGKGYVKSDSLGIGIGIAIQNRVYAGHNWNAGEMVTNSWRTGLEGQSGLPGDLYSHIAKNPVGYRLFIKDFFSSLVPVVSTLDPQKCFIQGEPFAGYTGFITVLEEEVPQFLGALERIGCILDVEHFDPHSAAKGAAMMFLQKLYSVPKLSAERTDHLLLWDQIIDIASN
ncbi:ROK family transcriptional regulator [Pleomorphochaeta sp. DL1XJH-081]|jgi:predicted NBD/HSP70 family sugar kinase|uniref:ROK family transcriptional regulator n=1 Tax=Pleomorphochaeta sp. DL1XJH-081 TaxID=3409690 RepID=UPI003BB5F214